MEKTVRINVRTFIAIKLPDRLKKELGKVQRNLGEQVDLLRFINPDQLHITLAFLGRISMEHQSLVISVAEEIANTLTPFTLFPTQLGAFPRINRPSIVWVGLGGDTLRLEHLVLKLERDLSHHHIYPIRGVGGFAPHITIGKVSRKDRRHRLHSVASVLEETQLDLADLVIPVREIVVYQSNLGGGGPKHVPIARIPLSSSQ